MPSVRVKRHRYSSLSEDGNERTIPRSLSTIFRRPSAQELNQTQPPHTAPLHLHDQTGLPSSSIVYDLWTRGGSVRAPLLHDPRRPRVDSQRSTHAQSGVVTLEGSVANLQVPNDGATGIIGSVLDLTAQEEQGDGSHHHDDIVEHLDVIDPQVGTVSSLTNAANSILIPPVSWYSRKPVVMLSPLPPTDAETASVLEDSLDRHVDDVMKRRARIQRTLRGVWSFLKTPLGVIAAIYGFLVVFWGAAIVIFLVKIINFHNANTQGFWVEVSSQVVNGLFTVTGVGLIPFRVLDTYRISRICHYKRKTRRLRAQAGLPQLFDEDDLPDPVYDPNYIHVLTDEEQKDLHRQQIKFQYSQTWYRPHGTETHRAFPINIALLICCLNDGNSIFQCILCGTMWGLNRFERPAWSTGTLIPASFLCGIFSAIFIARGGAKTKRTAVVEERLKAALEAAESKHENIHQNAPVTSPTTEKLRSNRRSTHRDPTVDVDELMTVPSVH
ncbi:hypothetical protein D9758_008854 [Tetrapyrgos nigripes]|uniref:Uncharacterized protein n=1 Tax=Tetrapyrgos nigripes TaxID=182062 RepID=A0A8H5FNT5_9AGAR|nr:hypothetical protein D9758_008854 [Tetrapyrgos nigripes]